MQIKIFLISLCKKTSNTALLSFLKQSFTKRKLLSFKNFKSLVFNAFLSKTWKKVVFLQALIIVVTFLISDTLLHAQSDNYEPVTHIDSLKIKLATHAASTISIESEFTQEKHLWMLEEVLISKGEFLFKKENSVKWQYNTPIEYTIIIHNNVFTIVNNNKISEYSIDSNPLFREINNMIVTAIRGDFIDNPDFNAAFFMDTNTYLAKLTPTNNMVSSMLEIIEIYFDKNNMQVLKVIFREPGDDFTLIKFHNKKINTNLSDNKFIIQSK